MISANDMSIIGVVTRFPNLDDYELEEHLSHLDDGRFRPVLLVIAGRTDISTLTEPAKIVYEEIKAWKERGQERIRREQQVANYNNEVTPLCRNLIRMRDSGQIDDHTLILYGIAGTLPPRSVYFAMSDEEKRAVWQDRMRKKFGVSWRELFTNLPEIFGEGNQEMDDWVHEGF